MKGSSTGCRNNFSCRGLLESEREREDSIFQQTGCADYTDMLYPGSTVLSAGHAMCDLTVIQFLSFVQNSCLQSIVHYQDGPFMRDLENWS